MSSMTHSPHRTSGRTDPKLVRSQDRVLKVVMADDDRNDQLLTVMAAEETGHQINFQFVDDGSDLMMLLSVINRLDDLPDVIILDLRMPRLDGHRTLDRLQAHPVFWQIPVLVFSTSSRRADILLSLDLGARRFETKPDDFSGMVEFIHRLVGVARDRQPYEDRDNLLADSGIHAGLLGPDLTADFEDFLLEEVDLGNRPADPHNGLT